MTKIRCYRIKCKFNDFCKTNCGFCTLEDIYITDNGCMDFESILKKGDILIGVDKIESVNQKMDYMNSMIDDLLYCGKLDEIENLFETIDIENTDPLVLLTMLTITDSWKEKHLPKRGEFYIKVKKVVETKFDKKKAKELLYDLK